MAAESVSNQPKLYRKLPSWLSEYGRNMADALFLGGDWQPGRQGTGYEKRDIGYNFNVRWLVNKALSELGGPERYDAYALRYPVGSEIPPHTDPAMGRLCHVRLNAIVDAGGGGLLVLDGEELPLTDGDAYVFRPDLVEHSVSAITDSARLVLSVGANIEQHEAQKLGLA